MLHRCSMSRSTPLRSCPAKCCNYLASVEGTALQPSMPSVIGRVQEQSLYSTCLVKPTCRRDVHADSGSTQAARMTEMFCWRGRKESPAPLITAADKFTLLAKCMGMFSEGLQNDLCVSGAVGGYRGQGVTFQILGLLVGWSVQFCVIKGTSATMG